MLTADGKLDVVKLRPFAQLGYHDYTSVDRRLRCGPKAHTAKDAAPD